MDMPTWAWWWPHWPLPDPQLGLGAGPQPSISSCRLAKSRCQHLFISEMKFRRRINHPSYPLCSVTSPYTIFSPFICYSMILCLPGFWNQRPQRPWSGDQRYFGGTKKLSSSKSWGDQSSEVTKQLGEQKNNNQLGGTKNLMGGLKSWGPKKSNIMKWR